MVARNGKPVGVLSRADLLEYLAHGRDEPAPGVPFGRTTRIDPDRPVGAGR